MTTKQLLLAASSIALLSNAPAFAQTDDPVLFTVQNKEVRVSEFKYIYDKNNGAKASYTSKSLREYLQLYINFKLQIQKGEDMKLHENDVIKQEQAQYRNQLANNYLLDREITEKLTKEAYERSLTDRKIAHIFVAIREGATEAEIKEAYNKLKKVRDMATVTNFADLAKQHSEDTYSKDNGGDLGWYTVLQLPYELETAMYKTNAGELSDIVRTAYGYHFIKVWETRPAYGQLQVSQILVRNTNPNAKPLIDSLYNLLKNGTPFEQLVLGYSEDNASKTKNGALGWVGINKYAKPFEDAVFSLKRDGEISAPFTSSAGWHIIKRTKSQVNPAYTDVKGELTDKIKKDSRFELVQDALVERIKKDAGFTIDEKIKGEILDIWRKDANFFNTQWTPDAKLLSDERVLFTVGNQKTTVKEFITTATRLIPERINMSPRTQDAALDRILKKAISQRAIAYEETQLDKKYPEFGALLREYEEGILLFEVKKQLIWDKASTDEEGLKKFYDTHANKYKTKEQATATFYTLNTTDKKEIKAVQKAAKKGKLDDVKTTFNSDKQLVAGQTSTYERGKNPVLDKMKWKAGAMSPLTTTTDNKTEFVKIESLIPERVKTMDEARGFVVADYQDALEQELLKQLRSQYNVKINEDVLNSLIKK